MTSDLSDPGYTSLLKPCVVEIIVFNSWFLFLTSRFSFFSPLKHSYLHLDGVSEDQLGGSVLLQPGAAAPQSVLQPRPHSPQS